MIIKYKFKIMKSRTAETGKISFRNEQYAKIESEFF